MKLCISDTLSLPLDFVTQTQAILAIKRVGKSYTASVQAEELLKAGQQIVAIDVTGAWWGLRSNAAGDGPGFPILIFGGDHGDVPLEETAGEVLAEAIVSERFSAILDMTLFRKGQAQRFLATFFEALYRKNREAMHLFMDEADFYAPQKPFGEEARVLGAVNDIVRRGGIRGIGCTLITQRAAVLNKDVLTQCGILTTLRISHPKDMLAVREWIDVHTSRDEADEMMRSLPSLQRGDAWIWAPGWPTDKGIFQRVTIRQRTTFDSGATPKAGQVAKQPKVIARIDIEKLGEQIKATVQRQKENDPAELKKKILELQRDLDVLSKKQQAESKPVLSADERQTLGRVCDEFKKLYVEAEAGYNRIQELGKATNDLKPAMEEILRAIQPARAGMSPGGTIPPHIIRSLPHPRQPGKTLAVERLAARKAHDGLAMEQRERIGIGKCERGILTALAQYPQGRSSVQVAILTGYSHNSGGFNNSLSNLRSMGYITRSQPMQITEEGLAALGNYEPLPTGMALARHWMQSQPKCEGMILETLIAAYPEPMTSAEVAAATGYSENSGGFNNALSRLRTLELITRGQPMKATDDFFQ